MASRPKKLGAVSPLAVGRIGEGDAHGIAGVPGVFGLADLLRRRSEVKGGKGGRFSLMGYPA